MTSGLCASASRKFVQSSDFDFDPCSFSLGHLHRSQRSRNPSRQSNMIFLNQHSLREIFPVAFPPPTSTAYFFQRAKAWRGLSRIQNGSARVFDRADKLARHRRNSAKPLQEIQRDALA